MKSLGPSLSYSQASASKKQCLGDSARKGWYYFFNTLALIVQMGGLVVVGWSNFEFFSVDAQNVTTPSPMSMSMPDEKNDEFIKYREVVNFDESTLHPQGEWLFVLCLALKSLTWWENFIDFDFTACGRVVIPFRSWKVRMHKLRQKATVFTSLWNIGIILAFPYIFSWHFEHFSFEIYIPNAQRTTNYQRAVEFAPVLTNAFSAFIGYFFGALACKLFMQKSGFSVPILLSTPLTVMLIMVQCSVGHQFIPDFGQYIWNCPEGFKGKTSFDYPVSIWQLACCGMFWISSLVIAAYIWRPKHNPMDKNEK
jgi:hypothetical protein